MSFCKIILWKSGQSSSKKTTVFLTFDAKLKGENEKQMVLNAAYRDVCPINDRYLQKNYEKRVTGPLQTILFKLPQYTTNFVKILVLQKLQKIL